MPGNHNDLHGPNVFQDGCAVMYSIIPPENHFQTYLGNEIFTYRDASRPPGQSPLRDMFLNNNDSDTNLSYAQFIKQRYDSGVLGWSKTHVQNALILLRNADQELYDLYIISLTDESFLPPSDVSWIVQRD